MVVTAAFWAVSAQSLPKRLLAPLVPGISQAIAEALREFGSSASVLNSVLAVRFSIGIYANGYMRM